MTFDIDANGIVEVSAKDQATGKQQSVRITHSSGLTREEIERLVREAESHADADRRKRALVDARNEADALVYATAKTVAELGGRADPAALAAVENAQRDLKEAMNGEDAERIRRLTESLKQASHRMAETLYGKSGHAGGASGAERASRGAARAPESEEVVDAEFEEMT